MIKLEISNDFNSQILLSNNLVKKIISEVLCNESKYESIKLLIVISSDEYLRNLKVKYFNMNMFTDVITFNLSEDTRDLDAEIYISWDRVKDNAEKYKEKIDNEMKRVIIHGCLQLAGFKDETDNEKRNMRKKEQEYINIFNQDVIIPCQ